MGEGDRKRARAVGTSGDETREFGAGAEVRAGGVAGEERVGRRGGEGVRGGAGARAHGGERAERDAEVAARERGEGNFRARARVVRDDAEMRGDRRRDRGSRGRISD